jgi:transcription-repair coupling factor (superfamily II helicase)
MQTEINLLPILLRSESLRSPLAALRGRERRVVLPASAPHAWTALWSAAFAVADRSMLAVVPRPEDAVAAVEGLRVYGARAEQTLHWPAHDLLPYERGAAQTEVASARLRVLERLRAAREGAGPVLVVASLKALLEPTLSPEYYERHRLEISVGGRLDLVSVSRALAEMGYGAQALVEGPGTFSRRGGILDVWSPFEPLPTRVELFGDEVESVRVFDPATQRSEAAADRLVVLPPLELPLEDAPAALARLGELDLSALRPEARGEWRALLEELSSGSLRPSYGGLAPYFGSGMSSLLDHLPGEAVVATDAEERLALVADALHAQASGIRAELEGAGELPPGLERPYLLFTELRARLDGFQLLLPPEEESATPLLGSVAGFGGNVERLLERVRLWIEEGRRVVLLTRQASRLQHLLAEHEIRTVASRSRVLEPPAGAVTLAQGTLREGWVSEELRTVLLGDGELWRYVEPRRSASPRRHRTPTFLADLQPGGWVVHIDHGIARYIGNVSRGAPGAEREYLLLEYSAGDKLYVPLDQVDRISPYIGAGGEPAPSRLGTADWARTKRRAKQAADELAGELLKLYARRQLAKGYSYSPDGPLQHEFESAFPYAETEDQLRAIQEVKADMESPRPMDRLVCGDVGYGKTEVALRAAFKAITEGKQVAVLVPTTVLALQHYETFKRRLAAFPVRVEMLSRLRPKRERDATVQALRTGAVDVVIGTHRLLSKDVAARDLGLLIVDEEQRFGVRHKETLKRLRAEVDVLTLTATPIPRTLQMALAGVRDMSVIETPPEDRLPIKTYVAPKSDVLVRDSVLREIDRGGQVFFVHNKVHDIARVAHELAELAPEARIAVGHGQMDEQRLEEVMLGFVRGEQDVLICTTIIENGLDIPNANTLIVDDAPNFGLSQLYQLRGRVGRGTHRAYAYLLYRPAARITEDAQKRLDAIAQATELGAGFRIAMKDLELRGAGNFLGPEQSGFVAAVGLDLYTRLLERAVQEARTGETAPEPPAVTLDLPLEAGLPVEYVPDLDTRLRLYRRLAGTASERDLRQINEELRDRFGAPPEPARNLVTLLELKLLAREAGVSSITVLEGDLVLRPHSPPPRPPKLRGVRVRAVPGQVRLPLAPSRDRWVAELRSLLLEMADARLEAEEARGAAVSAV